MHREEEDAYIEQIVNGGRRFIWRSKYVRTADVMNLVTYTLLEKAATAELLPFDHLWECKAVFGARHGRFKDLTLFWINKR